MLSTSFALLRDANACEDRYRHLAQALGGITAYGRETPITLLQVLDSNGLDDALWALRACGDEALLFAHKLTWRYAVHVEHLGPPEAVACNTVTRRYLDGEATAEELAAAGAAAWAAGAAAAAGAVAGAAGAVAWAAGAVAWAARAAAGVTWAAGEAAGADERAWQEQTLREMLEEVTPC